jgi:uncharacterized protein YjbI with pentapeptide repeats
VSHPFTEDFLEEQTFTELTLEKLALSHREFYRCTFRHCTFTEARFEKVVLESCVFEDCDLTRISVPHSAFRGVRFVRCKVMGVHFSALSAHPELSFEGCDLRYTVFDGQQLRGGKFIDSKFDEASFEGCDLVDADFSGSTLTGAVFGGCELAGADFASATGLFLDPSRNRAKDAFIGPDAAVELARHLGLRVAGHDAPRKKSRR